MTRSSLQGFPNKILYVFLIIPMHTTCPAHLILFDLITLIVSYEAPYYTVFSSLLLLPPS